MALRINTMEGQKAKHISLPNFTKNTWFDNRWRQVFRHSTYNCFGCGKTGAMKLCTNTSGVYYYIPKRCFTDEFCHCGLPIYADVEKCNFCFDHLHQLVTDSGILGKITNEAKAAIK